MIIFFRFTRLSLIGLLVSCLVLTGCGKREPKPEGFPALYPVSLEFKQEGQPCVGAFVALVPQDDNPWTTGGMTDAAGIALLKTRGTFPGVPAGKYKLIVYKQETGSEGNSFDLIDPDFADLAKTTLVIEVVAGKNQFEPFELGKPVRVPVVNEASY